MTNPRTWNERLGRGLRKHWWQTLTVILALGLGAGLWLALWGVTSPAGKRSATAPAMPSPSEPLTLIVISKGEADALTLEWTGGPSNATSWEYRTRTWADYRPQAWGSWETSPTAARRRAATGSWT